MKIAFFGTWRFSQNILNNILWYDDVEILSVVSQPDKPIWRKKELIPTPVKTLAIDKWFNILQPKKLRKNEELISKLKSLELDFIVVVAYGKIITKRILKIPKYGCINIHGSILPSYRWASPIQESIKNWETKTGITIMYMNEKMDEGDILSLREVEISTTDKTPDIFSKFEKIWPEALISTLRWIIDWKIVWKPQDHSLATYCDKINKEDWEIDFWKSAKEIYDKYRAYQPRPGIYTYFEDKKLIIEDCEILDNYSVSSEDNISWKVIIIPNEKIWVVCESGILLINQVKLEWKKSMDIKSFVNGKKDFIGSLLV